MNIIKAEQIKIGTQLAEADGFLWDVVEIIKETPKTITVRLCSDFSSFQQHWTVKPEYIIKTVKEVQNTEGKAMTIKLQGIYNQQAAKAVKELKTGDVIVWNYGYTSTVVDLIPSKTGKTITCMLKSNQDGVIHERKMGAERLVAIA